MSELPHSDSSESHGFEVHSNDSPLEIVDALELDKERRADEFVSLLLKKIDIHTMPKEIAAYIADILGEGTNPTLKDSANWRRAMTEVMIPIDDFERTAHEELIEIDTILGSIYSSLRFDQHAPRRKEERMALRELRNVRAAEVIRETTTELGDKKWQRLVEYLTIGDK
jgi:hypothetical protein